MRLTFKICMTLLLFVSLAESQEPMTPPPDTLAPAHRRPRPQRIVRPQPHLDDSWSPDPPPEGAVTARPPQPYTPPPATTVPAAATGMTPVSQAVPAQQQAENLGPATPPQVAYRNGQLTVRAINSTLESVLNAIRSKAGIQFEGLEGGASERVAISMGPLPEGEVLAAILGGSRFDFVVVERPDSPGIVQRVLLSVRKGSVPATAQGPVMQPAARPAEGDEEENSDEASGEPETPQDTPARAPILQAQPQMQINPPPQQAPQPQPGQATSGPKTPEELLEELKQMQQRQQQQQQQPQQPPPPIKQPPL